MIKRRQYKVIRVRYQNSAGVDILVASYATLRAAVDGARRAHRRIPDETLHIRWGGQTLRNLYHHGLASDPRWDVGEED